jgi:trehalose 6-phosphate synthase/phosphatase
MTIPVCDLTGGGRMLVPTRPRLWTEIVTRNAAHVRLDARLLIASNRLPLTVTDEGSGLTIQPSIGGLATGLRRVHERSRGKWIGWPGSTDHLDCLAQSEMMRQFEAQRVVPVTLRTSEERDLYDDIANGALWPVFHDRLDLASIEPNGWSAYESVNERFADALAAEYRRGDIVWVHDYHLLLAPALLRERIPDVRIGFFLHIPFPHWDMFSTLPARRELLMGMLGADLIGFHTASYRDNFAQSIDRVLGAHVVRNGNAVCLTWGRRSIHVGVHPMGIDADVFEAQARSNPRSIMQALEFRTNGMRTLLGVDRMDYSKGLVQRLLGFERLLADNPRWHARVRLIQVAVPSRQRVAAYRNYRREVEALVGRINGRFGTPNWTPVVHLHQSFPSECLVALYRSADVMLVTPLRDGMNLVAKEFVASRIDGDGVLILSEFAGAAEQLTEAIHINPYDVRHVADAIDAALTMPRTERRMRMVRLRARVHAQDVHWWANNFLSALVQVAAPNGDDESFDRTGPIALVVGADA